MWFYKFVRFVLSGIGRLIYNISYSGRENIPDKGAVLIASNHVNLTDPAIHIICVKRSFRTMAKAELFRHKLLNFILRPMGAFPIRRGRADKRSLSTASNMLKNGDAILIFPEGTRSKTGELGPFKAGVIALCAMTKAPIVPAAMIQRKKLRLFDSIRIVYGEPLTYEELGLENTSSANLKRAAETLEKRIAQMLAAEVAK